MSFSGGGASIEAVPEGLHDKVLVPRVRPEEQRREETLDADSASEIMAHLQKYEYGSIEHALFAVFWKTGIRLGGVHSIDLLDVHFDQKYIDLVHRPDEGTTLKNGKRGERPVAISSELAQLLEDNIEMNREEERDDFGREPLFTNSNGRMHCSSTRRVVYRVTDPCFRGNECVGHVGGDDRCEEAVSPHQLEGVVLLTTRRTMSLRKSLATE